MAYEWKLKLGFRSAEEAVELINKIVSHELRGWHYETARLGRVTSFDMDESDFDDLCGEVPAARDDSKKKRKADESTQKESGGQDGKPKKQPS